MNVKTAKKPKPRIDVGYISRFKMQAYGHDNLYPQNISAIAKASGTAELCIDRYAKFIEGYGFNSDLLSETIINRHDVTADDLLHNISADLARFGGFAIHVNYNVLCQVSEINFVPFENCRLEEENEMGRVKRILVHPDWTQKKTRNGQQIRIDEATVKRIRVFNPDPINVAKEIEEDGGIDFYNGQILWCSMDGAQVYPTPIYDSVVTEISSDEGLGNVKYRNVRNNFLVSCMLVYKKGVPKIDDDGNEIDDGSMISDEDLKQFQGDENTSKILAVELENDEDMPNVIAFPTKNYDKEFTVTDASVIERIYAQFHQELFHAIRIGKLGFSGQVMRDAYEYYAGEVTNEQRFIERAMKKIFENWHDPSLASQDFSLQPLKYISSENINNNTIENEG